MGNATTNAGAAQNPAALAPDIAEKIVRYSAAQSGVFDNYDDSLDQSFDDAGATDDERTAFQIRVKKGVDNNAYKLPELTHATFTIALSDIPAKGSDTLSAVVTAVSTKTKKGAA